tara:strand:- start:2430 stop:2768 length:339 start_codon:yes stop_codon:yes gene_type:complete
MSDNIEKEKVEIPCPGGGREIRTTYGDLARRSSLRSSKGHEYKFKSSDQSKFKRSMQNMTKIKKNYEDDVKDIQKRMEKLQKDFERNFVKAQEDFGDSLSRMINSADKIIKG